MLLTIRSFALAAVTVLTTAAMSSAASAQAGPAKGGHGMHDAAAASPAEPAARITSAAPVPRLLEKGLAVILFKTENVQLLPVYGEAAAGVTPRLGHLHVTLDSQGWHWVHSGGDPVVLQGLPAGPHRVTLELADANHRVIDARSVDFTVPAPAQARPR